MEAEEYPFIAIGWDLRYRGKDQKIDSLWRKWTCVPWNSGKPRPNTFRCTSQKRAFALSELKLQVFHGHLVWSRVLGSKLSAS